MWRSTPLAKKLLTAGAALSLFALPGTEAAALDTYFAGPRAMGMAGANVASVNDTNAQYYNPAAFGFFGCRDSKGKRLACDNNNLGRKRWGVDLNVGAGYRLHDEFGRYLDDLSDIDHRQLSTAGINSESDLVELIRLVRNLDGLDDPGNAITADANAGLGIRVGNFGVGARVFFQAAAQVVDLDRNNLGISGSTDLDAQIRNIEISGIDAPSLFTEAQIDQLRAAGLDDTSIQKLDHLARQEGVRAEDSQGFVDLFETIALQTANPNGSLEDNTTTVLLRGFGVAEIPFTYGYAINDHWAIGANLKLMKGRVYGTEVLVFDNDSGDVLKQSDENYEESTAFGVDVGVMGRYRYVNFGLVGRNLNSPSFDGPSINGRKFDDVKIKPQFAGGVAFIPFETLTFEVNYDLTKNETAFPGYRTRNLAFGAEWDAFRFLALRAGTYKNLLEDDIGWVYTAGLGLNLWAVRLDVAGAFSSEKEEFDGDKIPSETRVAAQLSVDF